jgi:hypothetical protein
MQSFFRDNPQYLFHVSELFWLVNHGLAILFKDIGGVVFFAPGEQFIGISKVNVLTF